MFQQNNLCMHGCTIPPLENIDLQYLLVLESAHCCFVIRSAM